MLNPKLLKQQGIDEKTEKLIIEKHKELYEIIEILDSLDYYDENNRLRIKELVKSIEIMEYSLQKLWKFTEDINYHTHWLKPKLCSCPKLDNYERLGYGRIIRSTCVLHGY